ncbi:alpha/beta fold hydrolase [Hyalangium rubrum]|uniref:Alpha/beta fold hydrolase n=1 Tax=Hyalangium rubrum TaxID=3103134 RepID=A0ABU5HG80_9BACT|nr:alpha/beta fold hydrolase [Hyalangium sp. s54d21]MDY7231822.1 alpha/beta fold hydrolase [Hyalangium sp. s54d21]
MPIAELNGQGIYFEGSGGSGRPIILGHDFLMDGRMFDLQVEALAPEFRVIRWDARALGRTRWDGKPFTLWDSASDCIALLDHLGIDEAVVGGMSLGGYCALRAALRFPDRVKALVLMSTRGTSDDDDAKDIYMDLARIWSAYGPIEPVVHILADPFLGDPRYYAPWLDRWRLLPASNYLAATRSLVERDDISHRLREIACPAIVFHGTEDTGIPASDGEELHYSLPGSVGFVPVPGASHAANLTHPELIHPPLIEFLRSFA